MLLGRALLSDQRPCLSSRPRTTRTTNDPKRLDINGNTKHRVLLRSVKSLDLHAVAPLYDDEVPDDPAMGPFCYLSAVPKSHLHPYKNYDDALQISDGIDPLTGFVRAYFKHPYLVAGQLSWDDDDEVEGTRMKAAYRALVKWIRREWEEIEDTDFYLGPEAKRLVAVGAQQVMLPPETGARVQIIVIDSSER